MTLHRTLLALAAAALWLAGCGNDQKPATLPIKAILQAQLKGQAPAAPGLAVPAAAVDPAILAEGRRVLAEGGKPVISVADRGLGLATFMVPLGQNGDVVTWANPEYQTIAMRGGVILATRGFGRDLISAEVPTAARLRSGQGSHRRVHYVLDGADQTLRQEFDCSLSISNIETINVLDLSYETRRVDEACVGEAGSLANSYWFDVTGVIRQSHQARALGVENLHLQAIID